jgi:ABC-type glutathione transport system ATPase component
MVMYLGRPVESGSATQIFDNPRHPYTRALLSATPVADPARGVAVTDGPALRLHLSSAVSFSSGRLGHMWPYANGVAMANPGKAVFMLGSDGSQMEGDDAEAARLAVGQNLNVKVLVDDNDVTIAGLPEQVHARLRRGPRPSKATA